MTAGPDLGGVELVTVLQALSDPVRLEIVRQLARCPGAGELACGQLKLPVAKSTVSHHLRVLHEPASSPTASRGRASSPSSAARSSTPASPACWPPWCDAARRRPRRRRREPHGRTGGAARTLRELHRPGDPVVLVNVWDAAGARTGADAGSPAIATASWSIAAAHGYADGEQIPLELMLAAIERIVEAVEVPVTADIESGFGEGPRAVAETVARVSPWVPSA